MTAQLRQVEHLPRIVTVRCEDCKNTYAPEQRRCPHCGDNCVDPLVVVCAECGGSWPCPSAADDVDVALRAWAHGDYGFQAAVEIVIRSGLREKMLGRYIGWSSYEFLAFPDFDALAKDYADGDAYLSGSGLTLLRLAANIAHGPEGAGSPLDLRAIWSLDERNVDAVLDAVTPAMRRRPAALAVAR